jgi:hypothetical protein
VLKGAVDSTAFIKFYALIFHGEGKVIPVKTWTDPEGSRSLRFPDIHTIGT